MGAINGKAPGGDRGLEKPLVNKINQVYANPGCPPKFFEAVMGVVGKVLDCGQPHCFIVGEHDRHARWGVRLAFGGNGHVHATLESGIVDIGSALDLCARLRQKLGPQFTSEVAP